MSGDYPGYVRVTNRSLEEAKERARTRSLESGGEYFVVCEYPDRESGTMAWWVATRLLLVRRENRELTQVAWFLDGKEVPSPVKSPQWIDG